MPIDIQERRRLLGASLRYCILGEYLYVPAEQASLPDLAQLSWARLPSDVAMELPVGFGERLPEEWCLEYVEEFGVYTADRYIRRRVEQPSGMVDVQSFGAEELLKAIRKNPEALNDVSKRDFELLCAELFVSRGFKVEVFREVKDDGIDFLAISDGDSNPEVLAVSCKHPDRRPDGSANTTGVAPVREIFGVSSAFEFGRAVTITSTKFSPEARKFSDLTQHKLQLVDRPRLIEWIGQFRWNDDEKI